VVVEVDLGVVPGEKGRATVRGMRWMLVLAACGALTACAAAASQPPPTPTPTATPETAHGLAFVGAPVVLADDAGNVMAWVRLNRPLRDNEGVVGEYVGTPAEIAIRGTNADIPGLARDDRHPTCYEQFLFGHVSVGDSVDVALSLGHGERLHATVQVGTQEPTSDVGARTMRQLGCPDDGGATRRCDGEAVGRYYEIWAQSATNTSCATALRVMRRVGRWATSRCWRDLCVRKHRENAGFRCEVDQIGEADWQITCTRGNRVVRGNAAD
jgi:hypothetical protein